MKTKIEVNNKRHLLLNIDENGLHVKHINKDGETERAELFSQGEIITLINWGIYQRENGNPNLCF